jgi:hypothetical protein
VATAAATASWTGVHGFRWMPMPAGNLPLCAASRSLEWLGVSHRHLQAPMAHLPQFWGLEVPAVKGAFYQCEASNILTINQVRRRLRCAGWDGVVRTRHAQSRVTYQRINFAPLTQSTSRTCESDHHQAGLDGE